MVAEFLESRLDAKAIAEVGGWAIAMQFKSLLSAELVELRLRGACWKYPMRTFGVRRI